jgi:hypothetical protein
LTATPITGHVRPSSACLNRARTGPTDFSVLMHSLRRHVRNSCRRHASTKRLPTLAATVPCSLSLFREINYAVAAPAASPGHTHVGHGAPELLVELNSDYIVLAYAEAQALTVGYKRRVGRSTKQLAADATAASVHFDKEISDLHAALGALGGIEALPGHEADVLPSCRASQPCLVPASMITLQRRWCRGMLVAMMPGELSCQSGQGREIAAGVGGGRLLLRVSWCRRLAL